MKTVAVEIVVSGSLAPAGSARLVVALRDTGRQDEAAVTLSRVSIDLSAEDMLDWPIRIDLPVARGASSIRRSTLDARLLFHEGDGLRSGDYVNAVARPTEIDGPNEVSLSPID